MSRNGDRCTNCVSRLRKCDGIRPSCRRCTRDGVECEGYSTSKLPIRGVSAPKKPRSTLPISTIEVIDLTPSGLTSSGNYPGPSWTSNISTGEPETHPEWPNVEDTISSPIPYVSHNSRPRLDPLLAINLRPSAPPYRPPGIGPFDEVTRTFLPPKKDVRQSMTPAQASLFDALFSLARPEDDIDLLASLNLLDRTPLGPTQAGPFYNLTYGAEHNLGNRDKNDLEDLHDEEVGAKMCDTLALDKEVKSNTLPFVLQSYALWMRQFLFEPIRIIPLARKYILEEYSTGSVARWRMTTISNAVRAINGSTGYTLEDLKILQSNMHQGFAMTKSSFGTDRAADRIRALQAMSTTYEFISVSLKILPLTELVKTMQAVAPIFRRGCPDPEDRPVNLPSLLSNINVALRYYATVDVLLSAVIGRPMNFRYNTTYGFGVDDTIFDLENGPGTRWVYGVPDRLIIIFARMNALLEEFGSGVDLRIVRELETEIKEAKAIVVASTDPSLAVGRLVVQECWRQVAYIYLYMGLCGADSHDTRVIKAHRGFMEVFLRAKPGRIPDSFLVFPLPILGIATCHPDDRDLLKRRILSLPECARKGTSGNQFVRMLECMWELASQSGRPTIWSDLRLASLYVADVQSQTKAQVEKTSTKTLVVPRDKVEASFYFDLARFSSALVRLSKVKVSPPKKGEVLVKLHAAALNYRDILISHEKYPGIQERTTGPDGQGLILTSDGAGEVVALGEGVTQWKTGDRVHSLFYETWFDGPYEPKYMEHALGASASGCLTQYRIFTAESLLPIPPHLSYEEASTIPCAALTAWHPFFEKQPVNNQSTVLVLGSGGVSVFGAQLCKAVGARVIATTSSQVKAERYRSLGVDEVINYREFPQWSIKVKELTEGHGVEQVLEVGGQGTLVQSVRSVKPNGYVHMIGAVAGNTPGGGLAELGGAIVSTPITVSGHMVGSKAMCERLDKFITEHKIKPVIDRVFGWNEIIKAFDYQLDGRHFGKIVVKID